MHKTLRRLPSLDFLRGFEAAGAAAVVHARGAGALRHAVGAVAPGAGARGGARRAAVRARPPLARADAGRASRSIATSPRRSARWRRRPTPRAACVRAPGLTVSTTVSFASLWVIPRLAVVSRAASRRRGLRLGRRPSDRPRARRGRRRRALSRGREGARRRGAPLRRAHDAGRQPEARAPRRHAARQVRPISRATCCCISTIPTAARRGSTGACGSLPTGSRA